MTDNKDEKEIDLLELARKLWDNKKFIIKVTLIGAVIGLIIAFSIPKMYISNVIFTANSNNSSLGNMGSLASLAGINLNDQSSEVISSELYPNIISSTPFVQGLLRIKVEDDEQGIDTTLYFYLKDMQKKAWWTYILNAPSKLLNILKSNDTSTAKDTSRYFIADEEFLVIEALSNSYSIITDKKTGVTTLGVMTQSPVISAFLADTLTTYLQDYIIKERTKKANTDLINTNRLYEQAKERYYDTQNKLATFLDRNKSLSSAVYSVNQRRLENEANLAYSVYTQMAQQLQVNKIKVQDDTPVFTIIQPAVQLKDPVSPSKKLILIGFLFVSIFGASIWIVRKDIIYYLID